MRANYSSEHATIKKDKWSFTIAKYNIWPISIFQDSFAFPSHCKQVYYADAVDAPGWRVVLQKEVCGKRVLPGVEDDKEMEMLEMGEDYQFLGLLPERDVSKEPVLALSTGQKVRLKMKLVSKQYKLSGLHGRQTSNRRGSMSIGQENNSSSVANDLDIGQSSGQARNLSEEGQRPQVLLPEVVGADDEVIKEEHRCTGRSRPRLRQQRQTDQQTNSPGENSDYQQGLSPNNVDKEDVNFGDSGSSDYTYSFSSDMSKHDGEHTERISKEDTLNIE